MGGRPGFVLMVLAAGLCAGCATERPERSASRLGWLRPSSADFPPNLVVLQPALIELPVGDPYINQDLWDRVDEQSIPLEHKDRLVKNGFRIGIISGIPPTGLQNLLTSERNGPAPHHIQRRSEEPTTLLLGQPTPSCRFELRRDGKAETVEFAQAQCTLVVVPTLTSDGQTRLKFTPQVEYGEASRLPLAKADRSGTYSWLLGDGRPKQTYPDLSWEITLDPNEYAVVGGRLEQPGTLGHQFFIGSDEPAPVQRLLVIRTGRGRPGLIDDDPQPNQSPPLASQAAMSGRRP
jgi:hypothetical protein